MSEITTTTQEQINARILELGELQRSIDECKARPPHHNLLLKQRQEKRFEKLESEMATKQASFQQDFGRPSSDLSLIHI